MKTSIFAKFILGAAVILSGVQTANAKRVQDIDYSFSNILGNWDGRIVHYRDAGAAKKGFTRICLKNGTGKVKYIWWSKISKGVNHLTAKPHSKSCANIPSSQKRVEWDFYDGKQWIKPDAMNLSKTGGELITCLPRFLDHNICEHGQSVFIR